MSSYFSRILFSRILCISSLDNYRVMLGVVFINNLIQCDIDSDSCFTGSTSMSLDESLLFNNTLLYFKYSCGHIIGTKK